MTALPANHFRGRIGSVLHIPQRKVKGNSTAAVNAPVHQANAAQAMPKVQARSLRFSTIAQPSPSPANKDSRMCEV